MPIAVIAFDFDPLVHLGSSLTVRWQTLALALVVFVCLAATGTLARRARLRADDLLYIAIGAAPGAIVAGRIGYALLVPEAFRAGPASLIDPAVGGLELGLAVVGGLTTGAIVAALLGTSVAHWAHIVTIPLLTAIAAGKLTMVLGGSGQGRFFDGAWATAFLGPGPWISLAPAVPSHPAQVYEAIGAASAAVLIVAAGSLGAFKARDGTRLLSGIAAWCLARAVVTTVWRDPTIVGPLPAGGVLALLIAAGAVVGALVVGLWLPRRARTRGQAAAPAWPDPETRPRF
ncbi:MAG TPA: prolipoprotein diacylglyceryl transferase family protein [Candidatus Limnocylindrales bacterium]|nr:prolipoprotein diacylglyceryl transferase family protein [Candidatus Limnocylindrales bacterium]